MAVIHLNGSQTPNIVLGSNGNGGSAHFNDPSMPKYVGARAEVSRTEGGVRIWLKDYRGETSEIIAEAIESITSNEDGSLTFTLPNGETITTESLTGPQGEQGEQGEPGQDGYTPIKGVDYFDGEDGQDGADGQDGVGIASIVKTSTIGLVDTYTITYTDGTTSTFNVTNGANGSGSVVDVWVDGTSVLDGDTAKIDLSDKADTDDLANVAFSGDYTDLTNRPTISPNVIYCTCDTASATAAKVATIVSGSLASLNTGDQAIVKFTNANGVASPTLKIGTTDAKSIKRYGTTAPSTSAATSWNAGSAVYFVYDGTYWQQIGFLNSTYSEISSANITNGSGSTTGLVTGRRAKAAVEAFAPIQDVTVDGTSVLSGTTAAIDLSGKADASHTHTKSEITDFPTLAAVATTGNYNSLTDKPAIHNVPSGGSSGQVLSKASGTDYDLAWVNNGGGGGAVDSVNGKTGVVVLDADDVGALPDDTVIPTVPTNVSAFNNDSGYITGMAILSYGSSTWSDFITAYNAKKVVYCRASSNSNPASGSQTRLAFMAYVNNAETPTEVEFQYYRSVSSHSDSQQGDQVYVYKLTSGGSWSVTTREAYSKIAVGGDLTKNYSSGTLTISGTIPTNVSAFNNDAGYLTSFTETDPTVPSWAKEASKPSYSASEISGLIDMFYPVGSYYETSDATFNPNTAWGGTWSLETEGLVHIGAGSTYTIGDTGGETAHTLTVTEMPSHTHMQDPHSHKLPTTVFRYIDKTANFAQGTGRKCFSEDNNLYTNTATATNHNTGGDGAHNNMQPYIVVNRWHRTA